MKASIFHVARPREVQVDNTKKDNDFFSPLNDMVVSCWVLFFFWGWGF